MSVPSMKVEGGNLVPSFEVSARRREARLNASLTGFRVERRWSSAAETTTPISIGDDQRIEQEFGVLSP